MPVVAEVALALRRYGDILSLFALFPVFSHVKFGGLLQEAHKSGEQAKAAEASDGEKKKKSKAKGVADRAAAIKPTVEEDPSRRTPPAWALLLLFLAELLQSARIFDASDPFLKRTIGEVVRSVGKRSDGGGLTSLLLVLQKLLHDSDVYELARFAAAVSGLGGLTLTIALGMDSMESLGGKGGPARALTRGFKVFLQALWAPRFCFMMLFLASATVGNWSALGKLVQRGSVQELGRSLATLLRLLATVLSLVAPAYRNPLPAWAVLQGAAAVARVAQTCVYERIDPAELMEGLFHTASSGGKKGALDRIDIAAGCAIVMDSCIILAVLPCVQSRKHLRMLLLLLGTPCLVLAAGGNKAEMLEPFLQPAAERMGLVIALIVMLLLFMGGFPTMVVSLGLVQVLGRIHQLDPTKF